MYIHILYIIWLALAKTNCMDKKSNKKCLSRRPGRLFVLVTGPNQPRNRGSRSTKIIAASGVCNRPLCKIQHVKWKVALHNIR